MSLCALYVQRVSVCLFLANTGYSLMCDFAVILSFACDFAVIFREIYLAKSPRACWRVSSRMLAAMQVCALATPRSRQITRPRAGGGAAKVSAQAAGSSLLLRPELDPPEWPSL